MNKNKLTITPLGGLAEFGKNMLLLEISNEIIIIDCGIKLLKKDFYGLNGEICDFRFLKNNKEKIKGLLITHGHLDHVGGIPFLLKELDVAIYASNFAASIIRGALAEYGFKNPKITEVLPNKKFSIGNFEIDPISVNHSIVESYAYAIKTAVGTIIHSGDFRCDATPYDSSKTDIKKFEKLGQKGVLALFSDSTGATRSGMNRSESVVFSNLQKIFTNYKKNRLIIATFSTQVNRIQQILDLAMKHKRKVVFSGRSILKNMKIALRDYYKKDYENLIVPMKNMKNYEDHRLILLSTGTQGEPNSSLCRLAEKKHANIDLKKKDVIVFSSSIIPGNDLEVAELIDAFSKNGNEIILGSEGGIHASGHGFEDELAMLITKVKPKFFFPVHGNFYNMAKHKKIGEAVGIKGEAIHLMENGQRIELQGNSVRSMEKIRLKQVFINNVDVASVDTGVFSSRDSMKKGGIISIAITEKKKKYYVNTKAVGVVSTSDAVEVERGVVAIVENYLNNESPERNEKKIRKAILRRVFNKVWEYGVEDTEVVVHFIG